MALLDLGDLLPGSVIQNSAPIHHDTPVSIPHTHYNSLSYAGKAKLFWVFFSFGARAAYSHRHMSFS